MNGKYLWQEILPCQIPLPDPALNPLWIHSVLSLPD